MHVGDRTGTNSGGEGENAGHFSGGSSNSIADHLSLNWSTNKILFTTEFADRITIEWRMLTEALNLDNFTINRIAPNCPVW